MMIISNSQYATIVPGTVIRAHDFDSNKFYVDGIVDGYYVSEDGTPYFCIEVLEDTTNENRESVLTPIDLGESEWPGRLIELGVEDEMLCD